MNGRETMMRVIAGVAALVSWGAPVPVFAQAPTEPKIWTLAASAGLALTSGNSDTSTVNAACDRTYDPQTRNVVKSDALPIGGKTEGALSSNRLGIMAIVFKM